MSSKMRKSRHLRKFQTMINSLMRKLHYSPLILRRTNAHLDSCSLTIAYTLLPGDHCSLLSLSQRMSVRWHATELTVKWRSTDRLLSPTCTYCVLGYLLLEPHWSPHTHRDTPTHPPTHPPTERSILARCIVVAHKRGELYYLVMMLAYFQHWSKLSKTRWSKNL